MLATLSFFFKDPKNGTGLFRSALVVSTLSSFYCQIHGALDVRDVRYSQSYCSEGPIGAIGLSLAAVRFHILLLLLLLLLLISALVKG